MKKRIVVLVTCAGAYHAPGVINHLKKLKKINTTIITVDVNKEAVGQYFSDYFFTISGGNSNSYIKELLNICKKMKVNIVIPFSDEEALSLSKKNNLFKKINTKILISKYSSTKLVSNKKTLMEYIKENGIEYPKFFYPRNISEVNFALKKLGYPRKKIVFKPINQRGGRGFRIINSKFNEFNEITEKKKELYISYERLKKTIGHNKKFPNFLLMEYLEGEDFNVDVLINKGKIVNFVAQRRLEPKHGSLEKGLIDKDLKIKKYLIKILQKIELDNLINLEMAYQKKGKKGKLLLYEINARPSAPIITSFKAGNSLLENAIYLNLGIKASKKKISNTKIIRYWGELFLN